MESLYGMCELFPSTKADITFPKADNDKLILLASFNLSPVAPVLLCLSDPEISNSVTCKINKVEFSSSYYISFGYILLTFNINGKYGVTSTAVQIHQSCPCSPVLIPDTHVLIHILYLLAHIHRKIFYK